MRHQQEWNSRQSFPLVTAICPTRNREEWLPRAIRCFQMQSYPNLEMIIAADGEDVQTTIANSLAPELGAVKPQHPVRYIYLEKQLTIGAKRNFLCSRANGTVIVHWDDDDLSHPDRVRFQMQAILSGAKVTGFYRCRFRDWEADRLYQWHSSQFLPCGSSLMYLKSWWQTHEFRQINVGEDSDFVERSTGYWHSSDGDALFEASIHRANTSPRDLSMDMYTPL